MLTERLATQTGLGTAFMGMVGLHAQIFRWMPGSKPLTGAIHGGLQKRLCETPAGWLLLSTVSPERREGLIRRLRAEAPANCKSNFSTLSERVQECGRQRFAVGPSGFSPTADMCAVMLPAESGERPMVLGFVYEPGEEIDPAALTTLLQRSIHNCMSFTSPSNSDSRPAKLISVNAA
jgi:DNA-binding IclR family transcriptional regulator